MALELPEAGISHSASRSSSTTCSGHSSIFKEPTSPDLIKAAHYLSQLFGSFESEKLCQACQELTVIILEGNRDCLHLLSERDVVGTVVKFMEDLPSHSLAQQAGCELLLSCNQQIELRSSVEEKKAFLCVLSAIRIHFNDQPLIQIAVQTLASIAQTALLDSALKESKAYNSVLRVMKEFKGSLVIQSAGLKALSFLLPNDQYAVSTMARQGDHQIVMDALTTFSTNPDIVAYGFQTLQIIASIGSGLRMVLELTDILVLLIKQLQVFSDNETVVAAASGLINTLTAAEPDVDQEHSPLSDIVSMESVTSSQSQLSSQVGQLGVLDLLTELLDKYSEVLEIQVHGFSAIDHICILPDVKVVEGQMEQWLYLLSDAFQNHGLEPSMMEAGCRCLARLLEMNENIHNLIGPDGSKIPLHNSLWIILLSQSNDPNPAVFKAVTMALFFLVEDDEYLQHLLLSKGACEALLECMREYLNIDTRDSSCVEYGCRALRAILRLQYCVDHKNYLVTIGIVRDLCRVLDDFISEPDVITEVFCVVACLADIKSFQEAVQQCSMAKLILNAIDRNVDDNILVESALEVLILLSHNTALVAVFHDVDVFGMIVAVLRKHVVSSSIQSKGCLLIRLLSASEYLLSSSLCTQIAKVVIDALVRKNAQNVQSEALACIYTLCECSQQMSEALVRGDVHLMLFTLLYRTAEAETGGSSTNSIDPSSTDDEFMFKVGTDIIYTLSCVRDFRQEMLSSAVQDGLLEGVKVLVEIGADINHREETDTPICIAVSSKNKEMVEFLLQNGVNNVHKALAVSREMGLDEITGLLLEHIGLDRNGGALQLNGLELETIKPTWILPSLGVKYSVQKRHNRTKSLGQLKDMLKRRRQSVDLGDLKTGPPQQTRRSSVAAIDYLTGTRLFTTRSPRSSTSTPQNTGSRSTYEEESDGPEQRKCVTETSSTRHKLTILKEKIRRRTSRSSTPSSGDSRQSSSEHSGKFSLKKRFFRRSKSPDVAETESEVSTTPTRPGSGRGRRSGVVAYEPNLSPIKGTPTHRTKIVVEEPDSGFGIMTTGPSDILSTTAETINTELDQTEDPALPLSPRSKRSSVRRGTVTGVELSRLALGNFEALPRRSSADEAGDRGFNMSHEEFTMSPTQLLRQLKRIKQPAKRKPSSSVFYARLDSLPKISQSNSYREDEEDSAGVQRGISEDRSMSVSQDSAFLNSRDQFSPGEDRKHLSPRTSKMSADSLEYPSSREEVDFPDKQRDVVDSRKLIKTLDLSSNLLTHLQTLCDEQGGGLVFRRLAGLVKLDLHQNQLTSLPRELMQELKQLSSLNASCNSFTLFPEEAVLSSHLTTLDLSANKISKVRAFPVLPNLVRLNLSNNKLTDFLPTLSSDRKDALLPRLKLLNLQSNHIQSLPDINTGLKDLEDLNISKNNIVNIPDSFLANLTSLKVLDASRNNLSHIAGEVAQDLVHLTTVRVANNNLGMYEGDFHTFITSAPVLQSIDASENGLSTLPPPYAWRSRAVREIRMTANKLTKLDLSDARKFWPHLESFYLGENKLKEIPKEIGELHSLSCMDISHNKEIRHLPYEMGNLEYLFMLNLQGLKNLSLDPSLLTGSTKAIISYLKSRHTRSVAYYHMKLMVVGAAAKGKTTVLNLLTSDRMPSKGASAHSDKNMATLGVSVRQWMYPYKPGGHGNAVNYYLSCWDFAGQEEFYSTHQCFLSQRSLYVLVYNLALGESELQHLLPWLLNIQARAPSSPVLILGTHVDKIPTSEVEKVRMNMREKIRELVKKPGFPGDISFGEISCFDERLVINFRKKVKMLIDGAKLRSQKIMGGMVPSNYLQLEELIQKEKKKLERSKSKFPVLQATRLKEIMEASKLSQKMDKAEMDRAVQFLHECGVLLHYSDLKTKLSELFFLNPEWLCSLMAQIITIPEINPFISKDGLMKVDSLVHVLKESRFPAEFRPEYIRLLERFEVALRQTHDTLLIPSHLPKRKPARGIRLPHSTPSSRIVRRYSLCYIPPGFWPRLIARLITFPLLPDGQLQGMPSREVWFAGMYAFWTDECYFLIDLVPGELNVFDLSVPVGTLGTKLLCSIVDNIEALIDEWFPGLRELDISTGASLVQHTCLCPLCPGTPHAFPLAKLMETALEADEIVCPTHKGPVLLERLAPDSVIGDLEPRYKVAPSEFLLEEITKNFLGKGGFGEVYKAEFRGQTVAIKIFAQKVAAINNTTPNHLIRQEVQILSRCQHPYIIGMVAATLRPKPMLFLEFAELGSLNKLYPYSNLSLTLKHKIAFQVAGALSFLHKCNVIYRDLKPDNVLIFSLSTIAKVNAKLSDYGIACYATEGGLTQNMGTAGCKAPELLMATSSAMSYDEKVDVYSYGLMLFVVMTNGHKPFEELSAGYEIDRFIMEGRPINDIDHFGCPPWPDMQDLINHCLQYTPSNRPSAQEVFDRLCSAEFVSLKRAVQAERDQPVQAFTTRCFKDSQGTKNVEVWMASVLDTNTMVSIMNLSKKNASPQGMVLPPGNEVLSILAVEHVVVLLGTTTGELFVYDGNTRKQRHHLPKLEDSIVHLMWFRAPDDTLYVCAGLANGLIAVYNQQTLMKHNGKPRLFNLGSGPVTCIKRYHSQLYTACGSDIVVIRINDWSKKNRWTTLSNCGNIRGIEVGQDLIWTTHVKTPKIQVWDVDDGTHRGTLHCDVIVNSLLAESDQMSPADLRVVSLHLQPPPYSMLWLGLSSGHLLVINAASRHPLMITRRHAGAIRGIQSVRALVSEKPVHLILTAGFGFLQRPGYKAPNKGAPESYGNLLVWESIMPRLKQEYNEVKKRMEQYR